MADISKIKLANGDVVTLKDATARQNLTTEIGKLKAAAYKDIAEAITDVDGKLASAALVKSYVDAQVGAINKFDVQVKTALPEASAETMYILVLIQDASAEAGTYVEYITIRNGSEGSYTYAWEKIGSTKTDLTGYVENTRKIAGLSLKADISVADLQEALGLGALAYKDSASGTVAGQTISGVKATGTSTGSISVVLDQNATDATLTKADYTPAGSITGSAISGGSINVTLKDQTIKTEAELSTTTYTPAGTIAATEGGSFSALKTATFGEDAVNGVQIEGEISAPAIELTAGEKDVVTGLKGGKVASFTEGAFTPASISEGFFSAGSQASYSHTGFSGGSFVKGDAVQAAADGILASIDSDDSECLVFTTANKTADLMAHSASYTAAVYGTDNFTANTLPSIDVTKFSGGSKAADTFEANELQSVNTDKVNSVTAAVLANAPVFTGKKYKVATTDDTALKNVAFTATNSATIVNKVEYVKQDVDTKSFTPVAATLGFAGTKVENALVTGVSYDKASVNANDTKFTGAAIELNVGDIAVAAKDVTVE